MVGHDLSLDEKRVYSAKAAREELLVATELGVVVVGVSDDLVGEFGVDHRCDARDVACADGYVAVATDEDVLLGTDYGETGFGPATAVGFGDGLLAGDDDGRVARYGEGDGDEARWQSLGHVGAVRAIDGPLVAAADGVYRVRGDELVDAGLDDVRDVAGAGVPLAATDEALYRLGNGWMDVVGGDFHVVSAVPERDDERAHAATAEALYARESTDEWDRVDVPADERIVDVAYSTATCAITADGTLLLDAGDGWRTRALGVRGVGALAAR
ncbi:MAG: hypothetical protein ABEJ78_12760 [Haloferacaceae archaeon]